MGVWPNVPEWLEALLLSRGIATAEEAKAFLHPSPDQLLPPERLHDLDKAAEILRAAARDQKPVVIYGDYDVDGVSASAILKETLDAMGVPCGVYIPDRHLEGYGLNAAAVETLAKDYRVLVTVDCGITSAQETAAAKAKGMQVIVTDHHRHLETLPPADAVVSPLLGDYPFPYLCGAGVAWKLALRLIGERALDLMEIAALATVADMVPLTGENRVIAALGLERLTQTRRPGLRAVMNRAGIRDKVSSEQVGFQIAPRMNACGRLDSARIALDMLLTRRGEEAEKLALQMESLNQRRRDEEDAVLREAMAQVAQMDLIDTRAIVVRGENWNSGVVGLAAGRIAEKYAYPTVALAESGGLCVGSARSAGNVDMYAALSRCADLFEKFGGHKQAAGLTIRSERVEEFRRRLSRAVAEQTGGLPVQPTILCDGTMTLDEVTAETVDWLARLEPFGVGNPSPRFLCEGVQPLSMRAVGAEKKHLRCTLQQGRGIREGIFFGGGEYAGQTESALRLAMTPVVNVFQGRVTAECRIVGIQLLPDTLPDDPAREMAALADDPAGEEAAEEISEDRLDELMRGGQGTLLLCRCRETALAMQARFPHADFSIGRADDPRAYHTVLLYGFAAAVRAPVRQVILCDGDAGESAAWRAACPGAAVYARKRTEALSRLLARSWVDTNGLRACYQALRSRLPRDLMDAAVLLGLPRHQSAFALGVLRQIGLIDVHFSPFRASLLPMVKRSPEESALFRLARQAKEENDGLHSL